MNVKETKHEPEAAFAMSSMRKQTTQGERSSCKHSGRFKHEEASCFEMIGYRQDGVVVELGEDVVAAEATEEEKDKDEAL